MRLRRELGLSGGSGVKNVPANVGDVGSIPRLGISPGLEQPIPIFLPGKCHGQRSLVGHSLWSYKEPDMSERLNDNRRGLAT